jgi:hypothetical protein
VGIESCSDSIEALERAAVVSHGFGCNWVLSRILLSLLDSAQHMLSVAASLNSVHCRKTDRGMLGRFLKESIESKL